MTNFFDKKMPIDALTTRKLRRLKWTTTLVVFGLPVIVQILGALILFEADNTILTSFPIIVIVFLAVFSVLLSGLYVVLNRVHLRVSSFKHGLDEWEKDVQIKAQAFSYRVIFRAVFTGFMIVSILGVLGVLKLLPWADSGLSLSLNLSALSVFIVTVFYLIFLLPTLFTAWTLKPLDN